MALPNVPLAIIHEDEEKKNQKKRLRTINDDTQTFKQSMLHGLFGDYRFIDERAAQIRKIKSGFEKELAHFQSFWTQLETLLGPASAAPQTLDQYQRLHASIESIFALLTKMDSQSWYQFPLETADKIKTLVHRHIIGQPLPTAREVLLEYGTHIKLDTKFDLYPIFEDMLQSATDHLGSCYRASPRFQLMLRDVGHMAEVDLSSYEERSKKQAQINPYKVTTASLPIKAWNIWMRVLARHLIQPQKQDDFLRLMKTTIEEAQASFRDFKQNHGDAPYSLDQHDSRESKQWKKSKNDEHKSELLNQGRKCCQTVMKSALDLIMSYLPEGHVGLSKTFEGTIEAYFDLAGAVLEKHL